MRLLEQRVRVMDDCDVRKVANVAIESGQEEAFYVMDVGMVVDNYRRWKELMPRIEPCYSVKSNADKLLVTTLAALGANFDCANKAEIELVTSIGVPPNRIMYASPIKMTSHLRYADNARVHTMTFDSESELLKIKQVTPNAKLMIRIQCDVEQPEFTFGKFGCDPVTEAPRLLKLASVMQLDVIGISFRTAESSNENITTYMRYARSLFDLAVDFGHDMRLLDLGSLQEPFDETWCSVNEQISQQFPEVSVRVMADCGHFFATTSFTLAVMVQAKRMKQPVESLGACEPSSVYFLNDGVYGAFKCLLLDQREIYPEPLKLTKSALQPCSIFGPTCDSVDVISPLTSVSPLNVGEWLLFYNMGLYDGEGQATTFYVVDKKFWPILRDSWPLTEDHFVVEEEPIVDSDLELTSSISESELQPAVLTHRAVFIECALK